jgi:hypothetical protein
MESELESSVSLGVLARGFGCGQDRAIQPLLLSLEHLEARERHLALADDVEREILPVIETQAEKSTAVAYRDIQKHVRTCDNFPATRDWVNSFLGRHADEISKKYPPRNAMLRGSPLVSRRDRAVYHSVCPRASQWTRLQSRCGRDF